MIFNLKAVMLLLFVSPERPILAEYKYKSRTAAGIQKAYT